MFRSVLQRLQRREDSLAVQSLMLMGIRTFGTVITFVIPLVLVRVFSQTEFGIYKQVFLILGTATGILSVGMWASLFYFVPRERDDGHRFIIQAFIILVLTGTVAGIGLAVAGGFAAQGPDAAEIWRYVPYIALLLVLSTWCDSAYLALPLVDRRPGMAAGAIGFNDVTRALLFVGAAVVFRSLEAVLWAAAVSAVLRGGLLVYYIRYRRPENPAPVSWSALREQFTYSLPFAVAILFEIGFKRFPEYFVAAQATPAEFAVYAVGMLNLPLVGILASSVVEVMLVRVAEAHKAGDHGEVRRVWRKVFQRLGLLLIPVWFLAQLVATDLIGFLFGADYVASVPIFRIFLTTILLLMIMDHGILRATGDTGFILWANIVGLAVAVGVTLLLAPHSVLLGAMTGYVFGEAAARGVNLIRIATRLSLTWKEVIPWKSLFRLSAAAATSAAVAGVGLTLPHPLLRLSAVGVLFGGTYLAIVIGLELVPRSEVQQLLRRFNPLPETGA